MPRIAHFDGVDICMYYSDHAPPHFHAYHGDDEALIEWAPAQIYAGSLPRKVLKKVLVWAGMHLNELDDDWQLARAGQPLVQIPPPP